MIPTLLFSSCAHIKKNSNAYASFNKYNHEITEITAKTLEYMIDRKMGFSVLLYTENCSSCAKAKDNLKDIAEVTNYSLYQIEMNSASISYLCSAFPTLFNTNGIYPSMYLFNGEGLTYTSSYIEVTDKAKLKNLINAYNYETGVYVIDDLDSYNSFKSTQNDYFFYTYSSLEKDKTFAYEKTTISEALNSDKTCLLIDKYASKSELISEICKEFNLSTTDDFTIISVVKNKEKITTLNYSVASDDDVYNLLNSFFDINAVNCSG